ncbi:heme ABC transporter ATP-binding protein [candidate division KSB3 bacterium]|uniref:Heme ABC transporter ATP-binding protein n=1 Tax=candidate division KSB3 bacterium TaxID=2044937 RepID=A0A2G6E7S8_9BACT|nr:MAG: heme ABC transporter ATP-binding protein [candidate division KSB3 bacterium]PIE30493.1 MAG: heme ABC transporter ATP-binding protein [candidate division KSB3 bacterium]
MTPLVKMQQIVKRFPGLTANDRVDFEARKGEIHGLLGENGAGKTTLMNILYGLYRQDSGEVSFEGQPVQIDSPRHALELGIGMVHQHFRLIPRLTVLENVVLGLRPEIGVERQGPGRLTSVRRKFFQIFGLDTKTAETRVIELAERFGLKIHPHAKVWELSVGEQQRVEIIKALYRNAKLLILDEPTAVLTPQEVDRLFDMLQTMAEQGYTIILITHKLNEVLNACHRITVLRNGRLVSTVDSAESTQKDLAKLMVGREVLFHVDQEASTAGEEILHVDHLTVLNDKGLEAVRGASFSVHEGEILGVAGVSGNGQTELIEAINGLRRVESGKISFRGKEISNAPPRQIIEQGVGYIPEDRMNVGLATSMTITENMLLKHQSSSQFNRGWFLDKTAVKKAVERLVKAYDVRTASINIPVGRLSGGNIQKIILAREISRHPQLLIASQPTRGLDVGAIEYVQTLLIEQKRQGKAILLISENLDETMRLSDRIAVIYEGEIVRILKTKDTNRREVGLIMAGGLKD